MTDLTKLHLAAELMGEWLTDNTDKVFEECPEIDYARIEIYDFIATVEAEQNAR